MDKKTNRKPVAIVLTCYNSGGHLRYAIDSILNNTKYPFKLILVESESTDEQINYVMNIQYLIM